MYGEGGQPAEGEHADEGGGCATDEDEHEGDAEEYGGEDREHGALRSLAMCVMSCAPM